MNTQAKIKKLQRNKASKKPETAAEFAILADVMQNTVKEFKQLINRGFEITDMEALLERLSEIRELKQSVDQFRDALKDFPAIPEEVRIASVEGFIEAIKSIQIEAPEIQLPEQTQPDYTGTVNQLAEAMVRLSVAVKAANEVKKPGQKPQDFIPVREVVYEGNRARFKDELPEKGSGAVMGNSGIPVVQTNDGPAVPVANADGTTISGGGGASGGLTDAELRATPVPVSGTLAAAQSGIWTEANSAAIKVAVEKIDDAISGSEMQVDVVGALPAGNNNIGDVDVASSALPTGAATSAKQDTAQTALDAIKTSVETLDNAIAGSEMQVDIVSMPQSAPPSTLVAFRTDIPTAGTRVQLGSNAVNGVVIQAPSTNTGLIYVGGATVSSTVNGAELQAGQSTGLAIDNTSKIYVDASVSGDDVMVLGS